MGSRALLRWAKRKPRILITDPGHMNHDAAVHPPGFLADPTRFLFFTGKGGVGKTSVACENTPNRPPSYRRLPPISGQHSTQRTESQYRLCRGIDRDLHPVQDRMQRLRYKHGVASASAAGLLVRV